ncbi:MAG TPA: YhdH/YhfP family quinone oxidoreductase [Vicinamibacterales bacterium]|nr:YhdH/YhfP family quinone oxidoreductase [Vicinamibacterales bacterium]
MERRFAAFRIHSENGRIHGAIEETTVADPAAGEVLIRAAYSSVNYKDALAATGTGGRILRRFPLTGGIDVAGIVEASADPRFGPGDAVIVTGYDLGVSVDGGYGAYVRVPADWVVPLPDGLSLYDAMALGTAGFTAGLAVARLEHNGLAPGDRPVAVTGATGGVGSIAVAVLARLGYRVTAITRKDDAHGYLRGLGASDVLSLNTLEMGTRPLEKATWAAAVDAVGGPVLAWLTRTTGHWGGIACTGLTGGSELHTTVMPFILRGVSLIGIDSVACPMDLRRQVWKRLATDMKPPDLAGMTREITLEGLPEAFATLLNGAARGRFVVRVLHE